MGAFLQANARLSFRGGRRTARHFVTVLAPCLFVAALGACGGNGAPADRPDNAPAPLTESATSGEVTLTVTADRSQVRVAEPLRVTVEARAPTDLEIELPGLVAAIEDFTVRDHSPIETEETEDGAEVQRQTFELDSNLSGERTIPELTVTFADGQATTAPLTIEVISSIEGEYDPTEFVDIAGPVSIRRPRNWTPVWWAAGALLALVLAAWWMLRRRRALVAAVESPPPPHVWALQQLDDLLAQKLVERGRVQEFYFRLSDLVRTYIELRFGLMAPERTTEEFLVEVQRSDTLRFGHKDLLGEFLTACDLVKFARHEPRGTEIDGVIEAARTFIEQTAPAAPRMREVAA